MFMYVAEFTIEFVIPYSLPFSISNEIENGNGLNCVWGVYMPR